MSFRLALMILFGLFVIARSVSATENVPENPYRGELVSYPGPWGFLVGKPHIILVSDEELEALADPDKKLNLTLTHDKREESLRDICERAQSCGQRTLTIAFDHFFAQYRPGQEGKPRRLTPDKPEYLERMAAISKFARRYGLGLELSLLSPLEIGPGYVAETGESGLWVHYRKGLRDPRSGKYSVQLWRNVRWANNKGPIEIEDAGVRVFAFREHRIGGTPYRVVNPNDIVEISDKAKVDVWDHMTRRAGDFEAVRIRVYGEGGGAATRDRVLVVQQYRTPEMDYFSENAAPYLRDLCDRYADAGVELNGLYSDEMHIQQDWAYFSHHDHGEFAMRYMSPGFAEAFAVEYGDRYADFARYMVYFVHGQEDFAGDLSAKQSVMHVFGGTPEQVRATALFRSRYYKFLQNGVVDLFLGAKRHLENRMGRRLDTRAHATWAESPTIDKWNTGRQHESAYKYEYTSDFIWSDTVHQAAAACYDYFKWGDYLTGTGNDHAEGGWLDRNYYGIALASSTGILNEVPYSYAAHWGMPAEVRNRRQALVNASGASAWPPYGNVQGMQHRDVDVLMLYPLDLVAVDERFGSWMTQYAYANYITQAKLLERGEVVDGAVEIAGRRFTTVCALFEPFPSPKLLDMLRRLADTGGRVVWSGPPPVLRSDEEDALETWQGLAGVDYTPGIEEGLRAPGRCVRFEGILEAIPPMTVLTGFVVDRIYPFAPRKGTQTIARVKNDIVATHRKTTGGGSVSVLGFRPRDDQSASVGYEVRYWFEILDALGAYPPTGAFTGINDNTEYVSRTTGYFTCRFPNGAVGIAPHLRRLEECWPGGFARNSEEDRKIIEQLDLPSDKIVLENFHANGHTVTFNGRHALSFRTDTDDGTLSAFCGRGCDRILLDGKETIFADRIMPLVAWAPVAPERRVENGAIMELFFHGQGQVRIPAAATLPEPCHVVAQGAALGSRGEIVPSTLEDGALVIDLEPRFGNRWLFVVLGKAQD